MIRGGPVRGMRVADALGAARVLAEASGRRVARPSVGCANAGAQHQLARRQALGRATGRRGPDADERIRPGQPGMAHQYFHAPATSTRASRTVRGGCQPAPPAPRRRARGRARHRGPARSQPTARRGRAEAERGPREPTEGEKDDLGQQGGLFVPPKRRSARGLPPGEAKGFALRQGIQNPAEAWLDALAHHEAPGKRRHREHRDRAVSSKRQCR